METQIHCPTCSESGLETNTHMVNVWVVGKRSFQCDGKTAYDLDYPEFLPKHGSRGTSVIILYNAEACDHVWLEETYFHEGIVYHVVTTLTAEQVAKYASHRLGETWRD